MPSIEQSLQNVAAQTNISGDNNPYIAELSHSQSINTIASIRPEYIISEDILAGQRMNGRMSNIRRFFCLFVTFDLLFSCLMWIVCIMLTGDNIRDALNKQVYHYNIETSLFDVVMIAVCRFSILLFFYACLYINHWIIIASSTSITCAFLLAKVFVYDWPASRQPVFEVLFVLVSFVLSWGEAWFLDFRVIPQESHARQFISVGVADTERTPLIRSYVQGLPNMSMYTESVGNFYSPMASPEGSLHRMNPPVVTGRYAPVHLTSQQENEYKMAGTQALHESWDMLNSDEWKLEKENICTDTVHTMMMSSTKVYKLTAIINLSPKYLLDELFFKVENIPSWNPALLESHKIQTLDENTDITYQISADGGAGVVASRDFVTLRHWAKMDEDTYVIASVKSEHASLPKNNKYIRGENGVGCWAMGPLEGDCSKCVFQWILNTNLNGWIPPFILNTAFVNMMFDYSKSLRKYSKKLTVSSSLP